MFPRGHFAEVVVGRLLDKGNLRAGSLVRVRGKNVSSARRQCRWEEWGDEKSLFLARRRLRRQNVSLTRPLGASYSLGLGFFCLFTLHFTYCQVFWVFAGVSRSVPVFPVLVHTDSMDEALRRDYSKYFSLLGSNWTLWCLFLCNVREKKSIFALGLILRKLNSSVCFC